MKKLILLIFFIFSNLLNAAYIPDSDYSNTCSEYAIRDVKNVKDNNNILYHFFLNKKCNEVKIKDLINVAIIDNEDQVNEIAYLNTSSRFENNCCVTRKYVPHFSRKENLDLNNYVELIDFRKQKNKNAYVFKGKCIKITKSVLLDNYIIRKNEINKNLEYVEKKCKECGPEFNYRKCTIYKGE